MVSRRCFMSAVAYPTVLVAILVGFQLSSASDDRQARYSSYYYGGDYGDGYSPPQSSSMPSCPMCPPPPCYRDTDGLLAFGAGVLLGLLLSLLRGGMMMMATVASSASTPPSMMMMPAVMMMPPPSPLLPGRRRSSLSPSNDVDGDHEDTGDTEADETTDRVDRRSIGLDDRRQLTSTLLELLHLPEYADRDLGRMLAEALRIFTSPATAVHRPLVDCVVCQLIQGLRLKSDAFASITRIIVGWYGWPDILKNVDRYVIDPTGSHERFDCERLAPACLGSTLEAEPATVVDDTVPT